MMEALIWIAIGAVIGAGLTLIWHLEEAAEKWGRQMEALARLEDEPGAGLEEVRLIHRGVPTEDGGSDLL